MENRDNHEEHAEAVCAVVDRLSDNLEVIITEFIGGMDLVRESGASPVTVASGYRLGLETLVGQQMLFQALFTLELLKMKLKVGLP